MAYQWCPIVSVTSYLLLSTMYPIMPVAATHGPDKYSPKLSTLPWLQRKVQVGGQMSGDDVREMGDVNYLDDIKSSLNTDTSDFLTQYSPDTGIKRNVPRLQNATPNCESDNDGLCMRERHPQCSVTYPEAESASDVTCRIQVKCQSSCSARCFAILQALPSYGLDGPMFNFSVATFNDSRRGHQPARNQPRGNQLARNQPHASAQWTSQTQNIPPYQGLNRSRSNATLEVTNFLASRVYRRFQLDSSYVCSHIPPCTRSHDELQNLS